MPFKLDAEVGAALGAIFGTGPPPPKAAIGDYQSRRAMVAGMFGALVRPKPESVSTKDYSVSSPDGHKILLRWFTKQDTEAGGPAVLYLHGGGYIAGDLTLYDGIIGKFVEATSVPFLAVDYRLAPEAQYPKNVDDAFQGLVWLSEHTAELGVDPKRIAVMGDSAGGGLAAGTLHSLMQAAYVPLNIDSINTLQSREEGPGTGKADFDISHA